MSQRHSARLLLKAYYERLYERMTTDRARLDACIEVTLPAEIERQGLGPMNAQQLQAYREACLAFVDERTEMYNPIGIQYTFNRPSSRQAMDLEFQLNWYDSRREFEDLVAAARSLVSDAPDDVSDRMLQELADRLIHQAGAFPDRSIVAGYAAGPTLQKLPDYIVASAIEVVICGRS
ncbi:MAG TPA: hypothetical protein PLU87_07775 [Sedimentisphaerales bacterium]|nr:hypothetical protein [Sedimentisphaerales bacterium]HRS10631.1 hypothetical protein [Sedimentisphaerales bacterium]HRV47336.1 hypothetical protein [Sedimentisphaerales bacterium]